MSKKSTRRSWDAKLLSPEERKALKPNEKERKRLIKIKVARIACEECNTVFYVDNPSPITQVRQFLMSDKCPICGGELIDDMWSICPTYQPFKEP